MHSSMRKFLFRSCALCLLLSAGCRSIDAEMGADGSWKASYYSYGLFTELGSLQVSVGTNGVASLNLNDLTSDMSTNHVTITDSSGKVIAEITGNIVEKLVQ